MTDTQTPQPVAVEQGVKYWAAVRECIESSLENADQAGADAITLMAERPKAEHAGYARTRRGYPRAACINAIEYALQECAA